MVSGPNFLADGKRGLEPWGLNDDGILLVRFSPYRSQGSAILLDVLSVILDEPPREIVLEINPWGKPELHNQPGRAPVHFNQSHSGENLILAFTKIGPVGVDLEEFKPRNNPATLTRRFFSPDEADFYGSSGTDNLSESEKLQLFYHLWVRKEAVVKSVGQGLSFGLKNFSVIPLIPLHLRIASGAGLEKKLALTTLDLPGDLAGALALDLSGL